MKVYLILTAIIAATSCNFGDSKLIRKRLKTEEVVINWYYYSYRTNYSADKIEISDYNKQEKIIYEAVDVVTDIQVEDKTIIIKLYKPSRGLIYTEQPLKKVFGYSIVYDTIVTQREYYNRPMGIKECN